MSYKNSSPGYNNKCMEKYKENSDVLGKSVLLVINLSLMQGKFPSELNIPKNTAVFESGDRSEIANYRAIPVLSSLSIIIDKVVVVRFCEYLQQNKIVKLQQFGFLSGILTETSVHIFLNDIYRFF